METIHEWNDKILALIEKLKQDHPELIYFLDEMSMTLPDKSDPKINTGILRDYYQSLMSLENLQRPKS